MAHHKELSASHIRYLLTMKQLEQSGSRLRCVDVAAALGLSRPSVHNMMDTLSQMGLIGRSGNGTAYFTQEGRAVAERYAGYYRAVEAMLLRTFPGLEEVQSAACSLMAEIPEPRLSALSIQAG